MSVYKSNRSKSKIDFYDKAIRLNDAIQELVDNPRWYPKRQTFRRSLPLMELSRDMLKNICIANSNIPKNKMDYMERRKYQTLAIGLTEALLQQFQDDCLHLKTVPSSQKKRITGLVVDVKNMLNAWKQSDYKRYGNLK